MNRKDALERYKEEAQSVLKKGLQDLEVKFKKEEMWLEKELREAIMRLCINAGTPIGYVQISFLRSLMDSGMFQLLVSCHNEDYFLDSNPSFEVLEVSRIFSPLNDARDELYDISRMYQNKIQKLDSDRMIRDAAMTFFKKRAEQFRAFFKDFYRWDCMKDVPVCKRLIIKWGEYRELSETLFLFDGSEKEQEKFVEKNKGNDIGQWDCRYVYQGWDYASFSKVYMNRKNFMFLNMREGCMEECRWENCLFFGGSFQGTVFKQVIFTGCDFSKCDFRDAKFCQVQFAGCKLSEADLTGAVMEETEFPETQLDGAHISREMLFGAGLNAGQLQQIKLEEEPYVFHDGRR